MDAAGLGIDVARQGIGIGAAQLGETAPFQNLLGDLVALGGHLFQRIDIGGPGAGLGLAPAFQAHLAEQDVAQLLGRADIEILARQLVDLGFQSALDLAEIVGETAQQIRIDGDAAPLHVGQHHGKRPLQGLIDRALAHLAQLGFQQHVQAQGHIRVFGGIFGRFRHRDAVEGDLVLALAGHFGEGNRRVGQMQFGQLVHAVPVQPAFQHIGNQHRVVDGIKTDAALEENQRVIFDILSHLQDRWIFQQRLQQGDDIRLVHLDDLFVAIELQAIAPAMAAGNVAGLARRHRQRHAAQARLHGIKRSGFGIDADDALGARPRHPGFERFRRRHRDIGVMVDRARGWRRRCAGAVGAPAPAIRSSARAHSPPMAPKQCPPDRRSGNARRPAW